MTPCDLPKFYTEDKCIILEFFLLTAIVLDKSFTSELLSRVLNIEFNWK